jgi:hypothetical protein
MVIQLSPARIRRPEGQIAMNGVEIVLVHDDDEVAVRPGILQSARQRRNPQITQDGHGVLLSRDRIVVASANGN